MTLADGQTAIEFILMLRNFKKCRARLKALQSSFLERGEKNGF